MRARTANSVFHFDVQESVAKSTHAEFRGCAIFGSIAGSARFRP